MVIAPKPQTGSKTCIKEEEDDDDDYDDDYDDDDDDEFSFSVAPLLRFILPARSR